MNSVISFPGKIAGIGGEIDYHGNAITTEVRVMHGIIDDRGKGIEKEMKMMRESFEKEMQSLYTKTRRLCMTVVAINVFSRVFFG